MEDAHKQSFILLYTLILHKKTTNRLHFEHSLCLRPGSREPMPAYVQGHRKSNKKLQIDSFFFTESLNLSFILFP